MISPRRSVCELAHWPRWADTVPAPPPTELAPSPLPPPPTIPDLLPLESTHDSRSAARDEWMRRQDDE